jgi:predicted ATPase/DNA-binding CsgD family transcriptional regulator
MSNQKQAMPVVQENILLYQRNGQCCRLAVGTPAWYAWLSTATTFAFRSEVGTFTARREQAGHKRGGWYWRAYRKREGRLYQAYVGTTQEMTLDRLRTIAARLCAPRTIPGEEQEPLPSPGNPQHCCPSQRGAMRQQTSGGKASAIIKPPASTIPLPLTSLVGREREIAAACSLLARPELRLLTLTGMGGVGKTRLALAVATEVQENFPDGVCFVELSSIQDADLVLPTLVQALGLQAITRTPLEVLQAELREQHRLLVLDNFEQVVMAAPGLVDLLVACPRLKLLVTSREVLRVRGEHEFVVPPLALPDQHLLPDDETLARSGAVALFLERAQEVQPTLELTTVTAPQITDICRRLDGLPLALELAAARLKVLSLPALLERLSHRLHLLTDGPRDLPARQQTLRQTIAWSYDLLSPSEQRLFRRLAVFVNGCTLEAAEAVYSMLGGERTQVLDQVTSLLDKHLLSRSEQSDDAPRLLMHETIREYGLEALAANQELERARHAHAEYYLSQSESYIEDLALVEWLEQLEREYANLHASLQWVLEQPTSEMVLRLESGLLHFWERHHRPGEGRSFLETNSQDVPAQTPSRAHFTSGTMVLEQSNHEQGATPGQEVTALQCIQGEAGHLARLLYLLGAFAWIIGDLAMARLYTEEGLIKARDSDEKITLAYLIDLSGQIALDQGEDIRARTLLVEGLMLHREAGDILGSLNSLFCLERAHAALGKVTQARAYAEEHLALAKAIGFRSSISGTLTFLGRLALEEGNIITARELFEESVALLRETNENLPLAVATNLQGIGVTLAALGRRTEAVRLWSAAESLCALLPEERAFVARASATVRAELDDEAFSVAWAEGQALTLEQALTTMEHIVHSSQPPKTTKRARGRRQPLPCPSAPGEITGREMEVLRLLAEGASNQEIATALVIQLSTVKKHVSNLLGKLGATSRTQAIAQARALSLL